MHPRKSNPNNKVKHCKNYDTTRKNKEFEIHFIPESGYPPTKNKYSSSLVEYDVTTYKDSQPMMKKFNQKKRVYFDLEGNVYKDKQSNKVWFNLYKAS